MPYMTVASLEMSDEPFIVVFHEPHILLVTKNKKRERLYCSLSKWCHQESNRGHKDFQSFALPTELWHLAVLRCKSRDNFLCGKGERAFFYVKVEKRGENAACFIKKEATLRLCVTF